MIKSVDDKENIKEVLKENAGKFVYKITPVKVKGTLKESKNNNVISLKSETRLNRREVFEKVSKYFNKKYQIFVESVDVEASVDLEPNFLKTLHKIVNFTFPVFNVYQRKIEEGENMNEIEVKSLIDVLLSEDISEMLGSSESLSKRIHSKITNLDEKNAKVYRIYKDGVAIDEFMNKVCGANSSEIKNLYKGSVQETLRSIKETNDKVVRFIINQKNYCLALVSEK